jgi:hypothetical protein
MLFIINNLRDTQVFKGYYNKGDFSKCSRGRGSYYSKRGGGAFISTSNNCPYPDS